MQFRNRGNGIQVLRVTKDADGKTSREGIGAIKLNGLKANKKLTENATPDEMKEIESWIEHYKADSLVTMEAAAKGLAAQISVATGWFETSGNNDDTKRVARMISTNWKKMHRTLVKNELV